MKQCVTSVCITHQVGGYHSGLQKRTCETTGHPTINILTTSSHMESHTHEIKRPSIRKDGNTYLKDLRHTYTSFSDPEDDVSSGVESFDEDDMYGSENGDEILSHHPDPEREERSPLEDMVCHPSTQYFRCFTFDIAS
jgi:hypothetical protein